MKDKIDPKLFWFAPDRTRWDVSNPAMLRTMMQQVFVHGRLEDVRALLHQAPRRQLYGMFEKIKHFLPKNVRVFWEAYFHDHQ